MAVWLNWSCFNSNNGDSLDQCHSLLSSVRELEYAPSTSPIDSPPPKSLPGDYTTICKLNIIHRCPSLRCIGVKLVFRLIADVTDTRGCCGMLPFIFISGLFGVNPTLKAPPSSQQSLRMICIPSFTHWIKSRVWPSSLRPTEMSLVSTSKPKAAYSKCLCNFNGFECGIPQ